MAGDNSAMMRVAYALSRHENRTDGGTVRAFMMAPFQAGVNVRQEHCQLPRRLPRSACKALDVINLPDPTIYVNYRI